MQVLVVDDSPAMRHYIVRTLEMTGVRLRIHEAGNGREGIEKASEIHPDLIITDLNMPEMGGEEMVAHIAADEDLCGTPILVLSADHSAGRPDELLQRGATGYLTKPVTPETLRTHLARIVESRI
jgi:two-component system, chemotaxis family, chemotaxis protein CheY